MQVLINLVTNGIKYNSKPNPIIEIDIRDNEKLYEFSVKDNGNGIPKEYLDKIFELFTVIGVEDRNGNIGSGIGLATVQKIINNLGGSISAVSSKKGSIFHFSILK